MTEWTNAGDHRRIAYAYGVSFFAAIGGFLFGYDLSVISGAILFLKKEFSLAGMDLGFAIAGAQVGCIAGPLIAGPLAERFGRKKALATAAILFGLSSLGTALPRTIGQFNIFRVAAGIGIGIASVVSPMYIAEIAPPKLRGRLVSLNQFSIVLGSLAAYIVSYFLSFGGHWRWMFATAFVPSLAMLIGVTLIPQSPRWLAERGRSTDALQVLARFSGIDAANEQLSAITASAAAETGTLRELFHPAVRPALVIAAGLCFFQAWSGMSALNFYAPIVFQRAGFLNASDAIFQALILNASALICTVVAIVLVDRIGRRALLLIGTAGMALGLFFMGWVFQFGLQGRLAVFAMFCANTAYQISLAPLAWLILSEVFPTRLRAKGQAVGTLVVWVSTYLSTQLLAPLMAFLEGHFGTPAGAFWLFGAVCIAALLFSWKVVPETKGRTLEEIAQSWTPGIPVRQTVAGPQQS